jgi:hypothetical protein
MTLAWASAPEWRLTLVMGGASLGWVSKLALVVMCGAAALAVAGCDTKHLNDPGAFGVYFQNDPGQTVLVALCHSDRSAKCEHAYYRDRIKPGSVEPENISPDIRTEWAVENPHGRLLRCVVLYWKFWPGHDVNVRLTAAPRWAWPCSRTTRASPR